jgi:hypothetical protein
MSAVVFQRWGCLAIGTVINIIANSTLVADSTNIAACALAKRTITIYAIMSWTACVTSWVQRNRIVDWSKAMVCMRSLSFWVAILAVVPIRACLTLVSNALNSLMRVRRE